MPSFYLRNCCVWTTQCGETHKATRFTYKTCSLTNGHGGTTVGKILNILLLNSLFKKENSDSLEDLIIGNRDDNHNTTYENLAIWIGSYVNHGDFQNVISRGRYILDILNYALLSQEYRNKPLLVNVVLFG